MGLSSNSKHAMRSFLLVGKPAPTEKGFVDSAAQVLIDEIDGGEQCPRWQQPVPNKWEAAGGGSGKQRFYKRASEGLR